MRLGADVVGTRPRPIIAAPMAGGGSTPRLAAAVSDAGGLGFLAAGYLEAAQLDAQIGQLRALTNEPFGVNILVPGEPGDPAAVRGYVERLRPIAGELGVDLGEPRHDDDDWDAKLAVVEAARVPLVSFTFGCPDAAAVDRLHRSGSQVCVTVTSPAEARLAAAAGADLLCVQGMEAGAHRGTFVDDQGSATGGELVGLRPLLAQVRAAVDLPLIATGGIMTGGDIVAVLACGAVAAQLGTAFLASAESGAPAAHKEALLDGRYQNTAITRAFSGRPARGLVNPFLAENSAAAPAAYPELHHLTRPIRAAAAAAGNTDLMSLWAGQGFASARALPAGELVDVLTAEAAEALRTAQARLRDPHARLPDPQAGPARVTRS